MDQANHPRGRSGVRDRDHVRILTLNTGSSSIKFALYRMNGTSGEVAGDSEELILDGALTGVASDDTSLFTVAFEERGGRDQTIADSGPRNTEPPVRREEPPVDWESAWTRVVSWLAEQNLQRGLDAIGYRVVHGGERYRSPQVVDANVVSELKSLAPLAPVHLPPMLLGMETVSELWPAVPQVACFDTAFHARMPQTARIYPLPHSLREQGLVRYGFHGLSYEYVLTDIRRALGPEAAEGRIVAAHLGQGASMTAIHRGRSLDTTMGFSPAGGLVMTTRTGDLDPGVIVYLLRQHGYTADQLNHLLNQESGLLGVSGGIGNMEDLLAAEDHDPKAAEAATLFCYQARKHLGALVTVLGGLDLLVFAGGVGENAPSIRTRICEGLGFLGLRLHPGRNQAGEPLISADESAVQVRIVRTDEDIMIARHTRDLLCG